MQLDQSILIAPCYIFRAWAVIKLEKCNHKNIAKECLENGINYLDILMKLYSNYIFLLPQYQFNQKE